MEYDKAYDTSLFPNYDTPLARFFNTDTNTTKGLMKLGDLETGAKITVHFKTMPFSANQFMYSDPFLVYDMVVEINNNHQLNHHLSNLIPAQYKILCPLPFYQKMIPN